MKTTMRHSYGAGAAAPGVEARRAKLLSQMALVTRELADSHHRSLSRHGFSGDSGRPTWRLQGW